MLNQIIEQSARTEKSKKLKFAEIARNYSSGEDDFRKIIEARALAGTGHRQPNQLPDPDRVILTGDAPARERFCKRSMKASMNMCFPFRQEITINKSDAWRESAALGAASLFVRKVFEDTEMPGRNQRKLTRLASHVAQAAGTGTCSSNRT